MDICIEKGNKRNKVNVSQNQPIQSELIRTSVCEGNNVGGTISSNNNSNDAASSPSIENTSSDPTISNPESNEATSITSSTADIVNQPATEDDDNSGG